MSGSGVMVEARAISRRFGGTQALAGVDLKLCGGEVHGLVGPNGAGKSTLVGILTGRVKPDEGAVYVEGEAVEFSGMRDAVRAGIAAVPQELSVPAAMTVAEFVTLGATPNDFGWVNRGRQRDAVASALGEIGVELPFDAPMSQLGPSDQKAVLVAQVVHKKARVLILDEPTAGMSTEHAGHVHRLVRRMRERGIAIVYVSHNFAEIELLCDRVTGLRDGRSVGELVGDAVSHAAVVGLVTGGSVSSGGERTVVPRAFAAGTEEEKGGGGAGRSGVEFGSVISRCEGLSVGRMEGVDLELRQGEILGIDGIAGAGVEDLIAALTGRLAPSEGYVEVAGETLRSLRHAYRMGVVYLPPVRARAILPWADVTANITLGNLRSAASGPLVRGRREVRAVERLAQRITLPRLAQSMASLSGGNQQKVLLTRLIYASSRVMVIDDPTVGVDVLARESIHHLIRKLAGEGVAFVITSSEPSELADICDSVCVVNDGRVVDRLEGQRLTERMLVQAATGGTTVGSDGGRA